jgi:hypothetical protein
VVTVAVSVTAQYPQELVGELKMTEEQEDEITPKVAYIPFTYSFSVDEFLQMWKDDCNEETPTQEDYDMYCINSAGECLYDMRGDIYDSICLRDA